MLHARKCTCRILLGTRSFTEVTHRINEAESLGREAGLDSEDIRSLKLERDTWDLLQNIYGCVR